MVSLNPKDIYSFMDKYPSKDLPHMIQHWKLGLYESTYSENDFFDYLLGYGIGWNGSNNLKKEKLGSEIIKNIYLEKEPISIVLKSHLLFENLIDQVLRVNNTKTQHLSFFSKISQLRNKSILKNDIFMDLSLLNKLRNEYSHNYYFDIGIFDVSKFSICNGLYIGLPIRRKKTKAVLNLKVLQFFVVFHILERLTDDFSYLGKLKTNKTPHKDFFKDTAQEIGEMIALIYRQIDGTKTGLKIDIELIENRQTTIDIHIAKRDKDSD